VSLAAPGPHDYTVGIVRALYAFSGTTCYFPGCETRVIVFVGEEPVSNVEIAHIRGAIPGSARHDPTMTNHERRSFANLILLCKPHHNIVDRLHPDDYAEETLAEWKREHERAAGIDGVELAMVAEDRLIGLIEWAVQQAGPQRRVDAQLGLGIATPGRLLRFRTETAAEFFGNYRDLGPAVVIVTARNQGTLSAYVNSHAIRFLPSGGGPVGVNAHPWANPALPCSLDVGESASWVYDLEMVITMVRFFREKGSAVDSLIGVIDLGTGETVESAPMAIELLGSL
jgi:hypothetical protein